MPTPTIATPQAVGEVAGSGSPGAGA
jgi:hypothetical protein